jgi:hypothetical protein
MHRHFPWRRVIDNGVSSPAGVGNVSTQPPDGGKIHLLLLSSERGCHSSLSLTYPNAFSPTMARSGENPRHFSHLNVSCFYFHAHP